MAIKSSTTQAQGWVGEAPWNPLWFWPLAIPFGFGAAGIVAGLNYRRLGRPGLMWLTIVISSASFIGVLVSLAFADIEYSAVSAIVINTPAALVLYVLQRADYESLKARVPTGASGGLDLPLKIGVSWLLLLLAFVVFVPAENAGDKSLLAEEQITLGMEADRKGETQRAISNYDEAIRLAPQIARAHYLRGVAYSALGERERAIEDFGEAIRLDPQDASAYFSRGVAWDSLDDFQRAKADYDQAIKLDPQNAGAYYNRAIVHTRLGMVRESRKDAARAGQLGFDPSLLETALNAAKAER